jgi:hypothetical protein
LCAALLVFVVCFQPLQGMAQTEADGDTSGVAPIRPEILLAPYAPYLRGNTINSAGCPADGSLSCLSLADIRELQASLNTLGFDAGPTDGIFGPRTERALASFRATVGLRATQQPEPRDVFLAKRAAIALQGVARPSAQQIRAATSIGTERMANRSMRQGSGLPQKTAAVAAPSTVPIPTRTFAGPGQFPPNGFRGYGFIAFPARAADFDFQRHMMICQAYMSSLPQTASVPQPRGDQFVTVWPLSDAVEAQNLNRSVRRAEVAAACEVAIDVYDDDRARQVISLVRQGDAPAIEGRGPFLFGWIPADGFGEVGQLILMLDLSRVTTYEQALTQLQSWQQMVETNPDLLREGFSVENMRRLVRDWSDLHGQAFLVLIGKG